MACVFLFKFVDFLGLLFFQSANLKFKFAPVGEATDILRDEIRLGIQKRRIMQQYTKTVPNSLRVSSSNFLPSTFCFRNTSSC